MVQYIELESEKMYNGQHYFPFNFLLREIKFYLCPIASFSYINYKYICTLLNTNAIYDLMEIVKFGIKRIHITGKND